MWEQSQLKSNAYKFLIGHEEGKTVNTNLCAEKKDYLTQDVSPRA